jgi:CheY-like chemotaxis protein
MGRGSTFHFTARFALADAESRPRRRRPVALGGTPVLVVDDNATNRRILADMLSNWKMKTKTVAGAHEAIDALRQAHQSGQPYRLILSDVHMPEVNGFTLVEWIRGDQQLAHTTVIMLTSGERPGDSERRQRLDIAGHLMKPAKQSELYDEIVVALGIAPEPPAAQPAPSESGQEFGALRILLAEDNVVNQKLAVGVLEKQGHHVTIANTGKEAVQAQESRDFDLILMDVQMPEMDGFEATKAIRAREGETGGHVPIIAMTAHALKGDRERCLAAGMDDYIAKPIRARELAQRFAAVVGKSPPSDRESQSQRSHEAEPPVIDLTEALESVEGDHDLLSEMVRAFLEDSPRMMSAIREAIRCREPRALQQAAHGLKGSMLAVGARTGSERASELESMGASGQLHRAHEAFARLEQNMALLLPTLNKLARGNGANSS